MGKLTNLLKKKKSRSDISSSAQQENASSTMSSSSYEISTSLSLCIPPSNTIKVDVSTSLMDDIMGELSGTTPDTPQPSQTNSKPDVDDFGLAFELSRRLDLGTSQTDSKIISSNGTANVGRLEQSSASKDSAFLRSQQQPRLDLTPTLTISKPYRQTSNIHGPSAANTSINTTKSPSSKLREASMRANNQLPSDDEGGDNSDSDDADDEGEDEKQQQFQQGQAAGKTESPRLDDDTKMACLASPEDVINRMKDRHRAVIAGAVAAARGERYEDYMDEYGHLQHVQPQGPLGYSAQYGMDSTTMYGIDDYRMQQQQQLYCGQGVPPQMHNPVNAQFGHPPVNPTMPEYNYSTLGSAPNFVPNMQGPMYATSGILPNQLAGFRREQRPSISGSSDCSSHPSITLSRRGSRQYKSILSTRTSEGSWTRPSSVCSFSERKSAPSDSGYSGTTERRKNSIDEALGEETRSEYGDSDDKDDVAKAIEVLGAAKVNIKPKAETSFTVDKLHEDAAEIDDEDQMFGEPKSLKNSTLADSTSCFKDVVASDDDDSESSDDDLPIIHSRRGPIKPTIPSRQEYHDESLIAPISSQIPYMQQRASMYQPQAMPYIPQQHQYIPMGYQFPAPPNPPNMGHHHTYSLDSASVMMSRPHSTVPSASRIGTGLVPHTTRRDAAYPQVYPQAGPKGPRQNGMPVGAGPVQSQYPIPATTLLQQLPRRSQSARVQQQQQLRSSTEYARFPNGGYQSVGGPEYGGNINSCNGPFIRGFSEPHSPQTQQQYQHQLQMMNPPMAQTLLEKQQQFKQFQQGFYMAPTHAGFPMHHDLYTHRTHQQILQAPRR
ncbi:hypothetical protein BGX21_005712 [Mortierella sp. AD011]|nr:hypothetical protein BGX20_010387 [Mortierella sp. AD010]KAF9399736.1 hypothetical protein BGX21_005712 [Mortierella sp. AD011]